jgi:holin-like protein
MAKGRQMLIQLGVLMMFQFIGEVVVTLSGIPFPGPLCGMVLLLGYLHLRGGPSEDLSRVGTVLIDNLGLLFVPAGTAVIAYAALLAHDGLAIATALIVSTIAAIFVCGVIAARSATTAPAVVGRVS